MEMQQPARTGAMQGQLWGTRAHEWAELQEGKVRPVYDAVIARFAIAGKRVLDVGCGAGLFAQLAAEAGAQVSGLDAAAGLIAVATARTPEGDFCVGEIEELPYSDDTFELVTGFNSFQFAAAPVNALREAGRVAKPGAPVTMTVWGDPEDCEAATTLSALAPLLPSPPPGAPGPFALSERGVLQALAGEAGLHAVDTTDVVCVWEYSDVQTAVRALSSSGPAARAIAAAGEDAVSEAFGDAVAPFVKTDGTVSMQNVFRYLTATA